MKLSLMTHFTSHSASHSAPRFSCFCARFLVLLGCIFSGIDTASAATPIELWHTFQGNSAEVLTELVNRFNQQQNDVQVSLSRKGSDEQTVEAAIKVGAAGPHLLQVRDDLGEQVLQAKISKPLRDVLTPAFGDEGWFVPNTTSFLRDVHGSPYAYPLAAQVPVLLYNKDAFVKAGLDPEVVPKTWAELQAIILKISDAGFDCPYTTSYQSWIFLENLSSWHDQPFSTHNNGLEKGQAKLIFNTMLQVRHIALMKSWVSSELLKISGDHAEGDLRFASGECAILTSGTAALGAALQQKKFSVGIASLPYYDDTAKRAYQTMIGGDSLWVIDGKSKDEYKAVGKFLTYLSTPQVAAEWHQRTGYLPVTDAAFKATQQSGYYTPWPRLETQVHNVDIHTRPSLRGIRLARFARLRTIINQHLNLTWTQNKPPKQALDEAVREGNQLIEGGLEKPAAPAVSKAKKKSQ